jgi:hypothetical protein
VNEESKAAIPEAPSTNVHRAGDPTPAETDLAGLAIRFPLNETPDPRWRNLFGGVARLGDYFAQIRFEDDALVLFLGGGSSDQMIKAALDEVQQAIDEANDSRLAEVKRTHEEEERRNREHAESDAEVKRALQEWSQERAAGQPE